MIWKDKSCLINTPYSLWFPRFISHTDIPPHTPTDILTWICVNIHIIHFSRTKRGGFWCRVFTMRMKEIPPCVCVFVCTLAGELWIGGLGVGVKSDRITLSGTVFLHHLSFSALSSPFYSCSAVLSIYSFHKGKSGQGRSLIELTAIGKH